MSGRFPGAQTVDEFWDNLCNGVESISFLQAENSTVSGPGFGSSPAQFRPKGRLEGADTFDAAFFAFSPREAEVTDPQHRIFLECAWAALEDAGYDPQKYSGSIGVFAGSSPGWYGHKLYSNPALRDRLGEAQLMIGNEDHFLATRVSYKLNLRGPSIVIQTACSTSLVTIHFACQSLLNGECDMALAGGVALPPTERDGRSPDDGGIISPDGHCRAFDAAAQGTVPGEGVGIVVLKRMAEAIRDGDFIYAIIKGSAVNNDGSLKACFTAPSVDGQASAIAEAIAISKVAPETITYIEAHGTATPLGDPIEIAALIEAFRGNPDKRGFCGLGSVKTNIGHLDAAAGVAGLIKTALALKNRLLPPSLHFEKPNPEIDFANSPFYVNRKLSEWKQASTPRRAGINSFGFGGTNAHVVLEEAPERETLVEISPWTLWTISARTNSALETSTDNLARHLHRHSEVNLPDAAYTLQVGRRSFPYRRVLVSQTREALISALETRSPQQVFTALSEPGHHPVRFLFPGQGAQYVGMGRELYEQEPVFRTQVDNCSELLLPLLGLDLRQLLYSDGLAFAGGEQQLNETWITQPALFVIEYALARLWMEWGVQPSAMIGHSIGEYVAACLAGVFSLEDGLDLVVSRGRLMRHLLPGAMLAVPLGETELQPWLGCQLSLAASNGPSPLSSRVRQRKWMSYSADWPSSQWKLVDWLPPMRFIPP